jgi:tellurite resistance protein
VNVPIGFFGAVMGLVGLGISARAAAPVFPGVVRAPAYVTEPWVLLGVLVFVFLFVAYAVKVVRHPEAVKAECTNPVTIGFCGTLPVAMFLVGGGLGPYAPAVARAIWWAGIVLLVALQVWTLARWLMGGIELAHLNAGWLVVLVGGIVAPGPGLALGEAGASRFVFGVSASAAPVLVALLFHRAMVAPPLPPALRPTWFILLVPPSLIYANGIALYPGSAFLETLFYFGLALAAALLVVSRELLSWPYGAPWWAFTFPLDALAYAAARHALDHPGLLSQAACSATLLLAAGFVVLVLARALRSAASPPA